MARPLRLLGHMILWIVLLAAAAWGSAALWFDGPATRSLAALLAGAYALATLVVLMVVRPMRRAYAGALVLFALLFGWWSSIEPRNDREWQPEVARLAHADIDGDLVTVHNIRNFDYHSETNFIPAYYDKTFDVGKLESVDLVAVYWMGPAIAHTILSFGFEGGDHLAFSIETRKEQGEDYSTVKGFFKQYELYYVVADERDVIRVRSNYRKDPPEDVYVYRLHGAIENGRRLFLEYIDRINRLKEAPEFYNTLTDNCTTGIWMNTRVNPGHPPLSWKILASGYVPEYLHEVGRLAPGTSFVELQRMAHIDARAQAADQAADFSRLIRSGIPGMDPGSAYPIRSGGPLENLSSPLGASFGSEVLAYVVSEVDTVRQVLAKVILGEADAGWVYRSDAWSAPELRVLEIPEEANVRARYPIAILSGAPPPDAAIQFVELVLSADGQRVIEKGGFLPAPP